MGEGFADHGEVGDLLVDLGDLGLGLGLQAGVGPAVVMAAGFQQVGDLVEGKAQALRGLNPDPPWVILAPCS